jgi:hypothetical protein
MQQTSVVEAQASEVRLVGRLATELEEVGAWLQPHFRRREAHTAALAYVKALLGRAQRKAVRDEVLEYAREALGEGGILAVDETGFLKKGEKSVGVARQYTGTAGKVENAQVGVFLSYVTPRGHALVDRELYLPEVCGPPVWPAAAGHADARGHPAPQGRLEGAVHEDREQRPHRL